MANVVTDPAVLAQLNADDSKPARQPAPEDGYNRAAGLAKAAGTGMAKGVIGAPGLIPAFSGYLHDKADKYLFDPLLRSVDRHLLGHSEDEIAQRGQAATAARGRLNINELASPDSLVRGVESVTGQFHQPQNSAEKYAETIGSFAPFALTGGASAAGLLPRAAGLAKSLMTQAVLPGAASEAAGQATEGSAAEPYARLAAAMMTPFAASGGIHALQKLYEPAIGVNGYGANHLVRAMKADTPAAVRSELDRLGPDATLADAGPALLGKAQGASLNSDEGRSILFGFMKKRDQGTNARIAADVERVLGPAEDPQTVKNAIVDHRSAVDNRAYPAALDSAPEIRTGHLLTQLDGMIPQAPVGSMERRALTNLREMLMTSERRPLLDAQGHRAYDQLGNERWQDVPVNQTDANVLHKVKGELDNVIQYDQPGLGIPAGALQRQQGALKLFRGELNDTLERQVPGYLAANRQSAALAQRAEAVNEGTQYLGEGKTTPSPGRFAAEFEPRPQGVKIAFAKGSRGEIDRILGTKANDLQALKGALQGEGGWNTAKLATVHGQDAADALAASVDRNTKFRDTNAAIQGNSMTAIREAAREQMKPYGLNEDSLIRPDTQLTGLALTGLKRAAVALPNWLTMGWQNAGREGVAKVLTAQGPARDAHVQGIIDALDRHQAAAGLAGSAARRGAVAGLAEELRQLTGPSGRQSR